MTLEAPYAGTSGPGVPPTISAFFDLRADAEEAVSALTSAGAAAADVQLIEGVDPNERKQEPRPYHEQGFWASLVALFMPERERHNYAEGLSRGGYMVSVQSNDVVPEIITEILDRRGTVDLGERHDEWRASGWSGPETAVAGVEPERPTSTLAADRTDFGTWDRVEDRPAEVNRFDEEPAFPIGRRRLAEGGFEDHETVRAGKSEDVLKQVDATIEAPRADREPSVTAEEVARRGVR